MELDQKVLPPGDPIPINVEPFDINDAVLSEDAAIMEVVAQCVMEEQEVARE